MKRSPGRTWPIWFCPAHAEVNINIRGWKIMIYQAWRPIPMGLQPAIPSPENSECLERTNASLPKLQRPGKCNNGTFLGDPQLYWRAAQPVWMAWNKPAPFKLASNANQVKLMCIYNVCLYVCQTWTTFWLAFGELAKDIHHFLFVLLLPWQSF